MIAGVPSSRCSTRWNKYIIAGVRTIPDTAHCFLIKHGNDSVVARLNLTGEKDLLTVLSGRERTVRLLDEIRLEIGDDPAAWLPRLIEVA
jgi:type IV secretion system protein VirB4